VGAAVSGVGAGGAPRAGWLASASVAALAMAPWLGLLAGRGAPSAAGALGHAVALVAALHGAGAVVEWAAGAPRRGEVWLRVAWGAALMMAVGGALMMLGAFTAAGQTALLYLGGIAHSAELARRARPYSEELATALRGERRASWPFLIFAISAVAVLQVLGAVGSVALRPWDGEMHLLGQLRLLADTGGLGDGVGFPRAQQLGGGTVLAALAGLGELGWARMLDGVGLALLLALVSARLATADREGPLWAGLLVLVVMAFARVTFDASLFWMATALLVAGAMSLEGEVGSPRRSAPAVLMAAALITLHHALLPCGLVLLLAALWPHRRGAVGLLALAAVALAAVAPYVIERGRAAADLPAAVRALIAPGSGFSLGRLAVFALVAAPSLPLLRWLLRADRPDGDAVLSPPPSASSSTLAASSSPSVSSSLLAARWFALAIATGFAGVFSHLWVMRPYAFRYTYVFALALAAFAVVRAAEHYLGRIATAGVAPPPRSLLGGALPLRSALLSLVLIVSVYEAQERRGGLRWSRRLAELGNAADHALITGAATSPSTLTAALAQVPAGATVALWLGHPEQLDHARHRVLDLRTPVVASLRARSPARFGRLLSSLAPDFLLYEVALPDRNTLAGQLCLTFAACLDDLSQLSQPHRVVWSGEGVRLLMLRR
jgi:hypothetical protein